MRFRDAIGYFAIAAIVLSCGDQPTTPATPDTAGAKPPSVTLTTAQITGADAALSKRINADSANTAKVIAGLTAQHKADSIALAAVTKQLKQTMLDLSNTTIKANNLSITLDDLNDALTKSVISTSLTIDSMKITPNPNQFTITKQGTTRILSIK